MDDTNNGWLFEINSKSNKISIKEVWKYRDLLFLFTKRDIVTIYKQTILGPLWYIIQPLLISVIFTLIFNKIADIDTGIIPPFLFNLAGVTTWNYFKDCLVATSDTFKKNENIFGKVYFPRIIIPISIVISNLLKFVIQLAIFSFFYIYYIKIGSSVRPTILLFFYPIIIVVMGVLGLGLGMIISSLVTKYRDLSFLISFGVQILMYISLVSLPYSLFQEKGFEWVIKYNPMAHIVELSRFMLLGQGVYSFPDILYTIFVSIFIFTIGVKIFSRTEKNFIDTI